jgi:Zn-dependent protease with chaperone function
MLARVGAPHVPVTVGKTLGDQAFEQLEKSQLKPSNLPQAQQAAIRQRWAAFLAKQAPETESPKHTLYIRSMTLTQPALDDVKDDARKGTTDGEDVDTVEKSTMSPKPSKMIEIPNAMALPNGAIVLTDGLVKLLEDKPDALMGVPSSELAVFFERARGFVTSQMNDTGQDKSKDKDKDKNETATKDKQAKSAWDFKFHDWLSTHPSDAVRIEKLKRSY